MAGKDTAFGRWLNECTRGLQDTWRDIEIRMAEEGEVGLEPSLPAVFREWFASRRKQFSEEIVAAGKEDKRVYQIGSIAMGNQCIMTAFAADGDISLVRHIDPDPSELTKQGNAWLVNMFNARWRSKAEEAADG